MSENKKVKKMILKFLATESNELLLTEMVKSIDGQFFFFKELGKVNFKHRNPSENIK